MIVNKVLVTTVVGTPEIELVSVVRKLDVTGRSGLGTSGSIGLVTPPETALVNDGSAFEVVGATGVGECGYCAGGSTGNDVSKRDQAA
jgi:hypothetical protein